MAVRFFTAEPPRPVREWFKKNYLPYDAEVEYIRSNGTQWIDTGICFDGPMEIHLDFRATPTVDEMGLFGNRDVPFHTPRNGMLVCGFCENFIFLFNHESDRVDTSEYTPVEQEFILVATASSNSRTLTVNGVSYSQSGVVFDDTSAIAIFAEGATTTGVPLATEISVRSFSIVKDGTPIRDFIPVRFTNELGQTEGAMYDRVTKQLFRNQGTGSFVLGPDKS